MQTVSRNLKDTLLHDFFHRRLFVLVDRENFAEFHELENFVDIIIDIAKPKRNFGRLALLAKQDKFADHRRRHEADILKIQDDPVVTGVVD